jgi:hypothetical protein
MPEVSPSHNSGDDNDDVETWKPEPRETLHGAVVTMEARSSKFGGGTYPYLEIENTDGRTIGWHASPTVAKRKLKSVRAQIGDVLTIKYLGEKGANGYKDFAIKSDRVVEFDWDEIGSDDGDA